ncbi:MAG: hypothetical protein JO197_22330 [Acidobacteria bacterium]|nr:hypothetical protein [Acidobacteriota bacterium]MBV9474876.1 hypothetical protein [Acidobacteriota bacterium]
MRFLDPAALRALTSLEDLFATSGLVVAYADGDVRGLAAAALLFADFAVLHEDARLMLDAPEGWAGAAWRLGRGVVRVTSPLTAAEARDAGLCDDVTSVAPDAWLAEWMRGRSVIALDTAAALVRMRGGDALERAAFARLFAIGEPQKGLGAFLAKVKPTYS